MLTIRQLRFSFLPFFFCSSVGLLPFQIFYSKSNLIQVRPCKRRLRAWKCIKCWFLFRGGLNLYRSVAELLSSHDADSFQYVPILIFGWTSPLMSCISGYMAFVWFPDVTFTIFNNLCRDLTRQQDVAGFLNVISRPLEAKLAVGSVQEKTLRLSVEECILMTTPWNVFICCFLYCLIILLQPNAPFSLYSFLPESLRSRWTLGIVCCLETLYATFGTAIIMFLVSMMVPLFKKCNKDARDLLEASTTK